MKKELETIIQYLIGTDEDSDPTAKINVPKQFCPEDKGSNAVAKNLNAAFLIALSGQAHPLYDRAAGYLDDFETHPSWGNTASFFKEGLELIRSEVSGRCYDDSGFKKDLLELYSWIVHPENRVDYKATVEKIFRVFFPEGSLLSDNRNREETVNLLREKRKIKVSRLNPSPVTSPAKELLFTSNILITVPPASERINTLPVSDYLKQVLQQVTREEQLFWYDHPIPVGVSTEHNEALYGLERLDEAVEFAKQHGTIEEQDRLNCVLSVSATHKGLQGIIKEYLEDEFKKGKNIRHLNVYVFTEADTVKIVKKILIPAAQKYLGVKEYDLLYEILGVDGEYGRHYSFLKAISAFWQVLIDHGIKGTFKIDLDQVFPQQELVEQSGAPAFEHFKTPLWGAEGVDSQGSEVVLGMIAGALVNKKDINQSLFFPDVCFPQKEIKADELIFFSTLPQALSTEAEMGTRYSDIAINGKDSCIHRIHVTGGTCGILVEALRKYRPFTPTFIGRAEDQAYILSILFGGSGKHLRYVHKDGLIMRHDKEAFASDAIKQAAVGKLIGDYIRILVFSYYINVLPWSFENIKNTIDPFTGCFVSRIPLTVVYLRFALKTSSLFSLNTEEGALQGTEFLQIGSRRLRDKIKSLTETPNPLIKKFYREKQGWDLFYDILDSIEKNLKKGDSSALQLQKEAEALVKLCKIEFK